MSSSREGTSDSMDRPSRTTPPFGPERFRTRASIRYRDGGEARLRILVWHGWLLEGTGSNVYAAKVAEVWRRQGHDVVILCQQRFTDRLPFVDHWSEPLGGRGGTDRIARGQPPAPGRVSVLNPDIGDLLPVFVEDHYEGFTVKRFVDLRDEELEEYLVRNVDVLRDVGREHPPDVVVAGHVVPGPVIARRGLGDGYVAKVHGSDLEYAARVQERYADLAREGLEGARAVVGASRDVLARAVEVAPAVADRTRVVPPGVDVDRWRPRLRIEALQEAADRLVKDLDTVRGRPSGTDRRVAALVQGRLGPGIEAMARSYDQAVADPDAADRLRVLAGYGGPVLGYLGKLIPQKGVERLIEALALLGPEARGVVVGFGLGREWLVALTTVLDGGDIEAYRWLRKTSPLQLELDPAEVRAAAGLADRVTFTGRLDHRYAPEAVAAFDVLVVPSTLEEAFGMVAAEGAAAGAIPLVARHSSLAEVAQALEAKAGRPGLLSFEPGPGATHRLAEALERLLVLPPEERQALREAVRSHVVSTWTWEQTAERLLAAAAPVP
jgi:glycosyltransferase involved in cell wall biosynthesis